jgi:hypothetical protein
MSVSLSGTTSKTLNFRIPTSVPMLSPKISLRTLNGHSSHKALLSMSKWKGSPPADLLSRRIK